MNQIAKLRQKCSDKESKYDYLITITGQLSIKSKHFENCHGFAHSRLGQCIMM